MSASTDKATVEHVLSAKIAQRDEAFETYLRLAGECAYLETMVGQQMRCECPKQEEVETRPAQSPQGPAESDTPAESEPESEIARSGYPTDIDISGVSSHIERVRLLAMQLPNHEFKVKDAALWLHEMGLSKATSSSLESVIYSKMKDRQDFRKTERGYAQFVGNGELDRGKVVPFSALSLE